VKKTRIQNPKVRIQKKTSTGYESLIEMNSQKAAEARISHSGESRNPVILSSFNLLDPGFRRGDEFL
jgi:hypothetical protein